MPGASTIDFPAGEIFDGTRKVSQAVVKGGGEQQSKMGAFEGTLLPCEYLCRQNI